MSEMPLVSIITPTHNSAEFLEDLIQSVLGQDYPNLKHLIIDDGSQDDGATVKILEKYPHLRWWSRENKGQYETMNEGLLAAHGDVVCFVSADDVISPNAVSIAMNFLMRHPNHDGVFGITKYIDKNNEYHPYLVPFQAAQISFYPYFAHISHCSLYIKRVSLQDHGLLFDPSLQYVGDYDWMIRVSKSRLRIGTINQELSKVRIHNNQASQKYLDASKVETRKVVSTHQINRVLRFFLLLVYLLQFWIWKLFQFLKAYLTKRSN